MRMISVVIPTLNSEAHLPAALRALFDAAIDGLVSEVIVSDGSSTDLTRDIAEAAGAVLIAGERSRGQQLRRGAAAARKPWLLFLHADTVLAPGWEVAAKTLIASGGETAGVFRFRLDDRGFWPWLLERLVALRCALFRLPYGDQGLLISRALYNAVGGFAALPLMEDVDLVRRLGRRRIVMLNATAVTSADRFRREGYLRRSARNLCCLFLYFGGVPAERLARLYG